MPTIVYQLQARRCFRLDATAQSPYGHVRGGPPSHSGVKPSDNVRAARLHYLLNLNDPSLGITSAPFQWLPLYWSPDYEEGFKYRILGDNEIQISSVPLKQYFPENFLPALTVSNVELNDLGYNPSDFDDAYCLSGLFGIDHLGTPMKLRVIKQLQEHHGLLYERGPPESNDELLFDVGQAPFVQGMPNEPCPYETCPNHEFDPFDGHSWQGISNLLIQIMPESETEPELFDELAGGDSGELTFQVCRLCFSVCAYNSST